MAELAEVWDASKAYLRGQFIKLINRIKTETKSWEQFVISKAQRMESAYVANPSANTKWAWLASQSLSRQVAIQLAENKYFFSQQ